MLERLDDGFADQRQFLDDAGHELQDAADRAARPPRAARRGRPRRGRRDAGPAARRGRPDVAARRRPDPAGQDPTTRLPRPRRRSTSTALTPTLLAKARGLGERDWQLDDVATGTAVLDEQRITQAVLQLADNAVKHTDPGDDDRDRLLGAPTAPLRLWVRDTGAGVDPADRGHHLRAVRAQPRTPRRRGLRPGPVDRPRHRRGPRRHRRRSATPSRRGARVELILPDRSTKETPWPRS